MHEYPESDDPRYDAGLPHYRPGPQQAPGKDKASEGGRLGREKNPLAAHGARAKKLRCRHHQLGPDLGHHGLSHSPEEHRPGDGKQPLKEDHVAQRVTTKTHIEIWEKHDDEVKRIEREVYELQAREFDRIRRSTEH